MTGRPRSSDRLRELFMVSTDPLRLYKTEALYHLQVDWTCDLLDIVDAGVETTGAGERFFSEMSRAA